MLVFVSYAHDDASWIKERLSQADAAILLISHPFLGSRFCLFEEVQELLKRRQEEGLRVYPILVSPVDLGAVPWIAELALRPRDRSGRLASLEGLNPRRRGA